MPGPITIFSARKIITMDPAVEEATHVAVRDGIILEVGTLNECAVWGDHTLDDRFGDSILIPGLIESHAHLLDGLLWAKAEYVGPIDRRDPSGKLHKGLASIPALVKRLKEVEAAISDPTAPLVGWGVDPSLNDLPDPITRHDLDQVSKTRPIFLLAASCHIAYVNSATLELANYAAIKAPGVLRDASGAPTGELQEMAAMMAAIKAVASNLVGASTDAEQFFNFAKVAQVRGVTTIVDGGGSTYFEPAFLQAALAATGSPDFPVRIVAHNNGITVPKVEDMIEAATMLRGKGNDKLVFQGIKILLDGSNQGFTGRLRPPGYLRTGANGLWNRAPEELRRIVSAMHAAGMQIVAHCNADQASEAFIEAVAAAQAEKPRFDHRHFIVHGQLLNESQLRRMATLGISATLFSNHMYYWGDFHRTHTFGAFRAAAMNPAATALRLGVIVAAHSDTPVSPVDPLLTMWAAVNRVTTTGRVQGPRERVSAYEGLRMMTYNAAWLLHRDHEIGSIRVGKRADFTVLAHDPLAVEPMAIKDIPVRGTILGGRVFPTAG
ncbi:amidohydrolase [Reyranella sp.]|uniref:amidohydrolase n=1 Tax=Reyranella sp. TaxID=1929291 RepID=UPI0012228569|nr:amidohydrolase [Reyranella sp.]TAJ88349.1 MAG: amidohydrolase [Reyranella sp.]